MQHGNGATQAPVKSPKHSPRGSGKRGEDYPAATDKTVKELILTTRALQSELDKLKLINHLRREEGFRAVKEKIAETKRQCKQFDIKWSECRSLWDREDDHGSR